jgi:hypothetical protein
MLTRLRERQQRLRRELGFARERSQPPTWRRMTPGGLIRPAERPGHLASTAHVQAAYPFVAQASLGSRGVLVGRNVYGGVFALDPWELYVAGLLQDPNMLVLGLKGYGKSALCKTWVSRQRVFGRRIEVIERKGEYGPVVQAMGGASLRLEPGVRLNPLERVGSRESRESLLRAVTRALLDRELAPAERVGLSAALGAVDARHSEREVVIPDVVAELREPSAELALELNVDQGEARSDLRECMLALRDLSTGPLRGMFDGPTNAGRGIWDRPAVAIDISQIARHAHGADENTALAIALICATAFLDGQRHARDQRARAAGHDPDKTVRVNDEAWRALAVPGAAEYYSSALKLSRDSGVQIRDRAPSPVRPVCNGRRWLADAAARRRPGVGSCDPCHLPSGRAGGATHRRLPPAIVNRARAHHPARTGRGTVAGRRARIPRQAPDRRRRVGARADR